MGGIHLGNLTGDADLLCVFLQETVAGAGAGQREHEPPVAAFFLPPTLRNANRGAVLSRLGLEIEFERRRSPSHTTKAPTGGCDWANDVFPNSISSRADFECSGFAALDADEKKAATGGVFTLTSAGTGDSLLEEDAQKIAAYIRSEVDAGRRQVP